MDSKKQRPQKNALPLRVVLLSSFAALSLSGCGGSGPVVSPCIIEAGENPRGICVSGETNDAYIKTIDEMENYVCLSPDDFKKVLRALRLPRSVQNTVLRRYNDLYAMKKLGLPVSLDYRY
jgi:hypothetical protein